MRGVFMLQVYIYRFWLSTLFLAAGAIRFVSLVGTSRSERSTTQRSEIAEKNSPSFLCALCGLCRESFAEFESSKSRGPNFDSRFNAHVPRREHKQLILQHPPLNLQQAA